MAALPSHKEKKTAEMQLGLSYSRSPPWILHEGETHVKTPPKLPFSQHLDPSSCGCETSEFVLLSIWDLWKARRLQIALAVSTKFTLSLGTRGNPHIWPRERKWKIQMKEKPKSWEMRTACLSLSECRPKITLKSHWVIFSFLLKGTYELFLNDYSLFLVFSLFAWFRMARLGWTIMQSQSDQNLPFVGPVLKNRKLHSKDTASLTMEAT